MITSTNKEAYPNTLIVILGHDEDKYNARIPGTSVHPHEGCRTAVRGLSQPLKSSTAVPVHRLQILFSSYPISLSFNQSVVAKIKKHFNQFTMSLLFCVIL